jgi:hypothetical protein
MVRFESWFWYKGFSPLILKLTEGQIFDDASQRLQSLYRRATARMIILISTSKVTKLTVIVKILCFEKTENIKKTLVPK